MRTLFLLVMLSFMHIRAQEKAHRIMAAYYSGITFSSMFDANSYIGMPFGLQFITPKSNYISVEAGFKMNTDYKFMLATGGENEVKSQIYYECSFGKTMASNKSGSARLIVLAGLQVQEVFYQGKFLYCQHRSWFGPEGPVYKAKTFWLPAIPLHLKGLLSARHVGISVDMFANLSKYSDIGIRLTHYLGRLRE